MREQMEYVVHQRGLAATLKAVLDRESETFALCKRLMRDAAATLLTAAQEDGAVRADVQPGDVLLMLHGVGAAAAAAPESFDRLLSVLLEGLRAT
jgi:hypothetical protein